jgi:hypothetical protein
MQTMMKFPRRLIFNFIAKLTLALFIGSQAQADTGSKVCDWAYEAFAEKVSETCQRDLLSKLTDEQDKIFARRMFANWEPLKGYELVIDNGLIQYINDKTGDDFQMFWLSHMPAIAVIDGVAVFDDAKDPSVYRRIERMLRKAEETNTALNVPRLNPIQSFLFSNEAYAMASSRRQFVPFVFTVAGRSNTAEEYFDNDDEGGDTKSGWAAGALKDKGYLPKSNSWGFNPGQSLVCKNPPESGMLASHKETIDGKEVEITAISRTDFIVKDYPKTGNTLKVHMRGEATSAAYGSEQRVARTDSRGKQLWSKRNSKTGKRYRLYRSAIPCNDMFKDSDNFHKQCVNAWFDLADKEEFKEIKAYLDEPVVKIEEKSYVEKFGDTIGGLLSSGKGDPGSLRGIRCSTFYAGNGDSDRQKRKHCEDYFKHLVTGDKGAHVKEGGATYQVCEGANINTCVKKDPGEIALADKESVGTASWYKEYEARRNYRDLLRADLERIDYRNLSAAEKRAKVDEICPLPQAMGSSIAFSKCSAPPKGVKRATVDAYKVISGADKRTPDAAGGPLRDRIERRLIGNMMMGDCCASKNSVCIAKLREKYNIDLDGSKHEKSVH